MAKDEMNRVEYVKSSIESDLKANLTISGRDYSPELGVILGSYLIDSQNLTALLLSGVICVGELETRISEETGEKVSFHETKKCGVAVHGLWSEGNVEGLEELKRYANELMGRGKESS